MKVAIIGAGPAGIEAASLLAQQGVNVTLFEQEASPLKNLTDKAFLFPDFAEAEQLVLALTQKLRNPMIQVETSTPIVDLQEDSRQWILTTQQGKRHIFDRVLVATGYTPFDAHRKEELGYGIYKGIHTSLEMEQMLKTKHIVNTVGDIPRRITFLQCVGSRDEKTGNHYCSKICCVTAVKQAIEAKKLLPQTEVSVFYMDLRMWGQGFEEMYRHAQEEYHIQFVRGRISEASSTFDGRVQIKAEDTLMGLPLKMTTDLLILMVGMEASQGTRTLAKACGQCGDYGFFKTVDPQLGDNLTSLPHLYAAGTCKRPMSINDTLNDARSAAWRLMED
ncbi:MAG: FAD-dependent oxidoreductase [Bacteroidales bacterium]|nr:FAD-dependent oxidoreductase [Bacteroidales bacterium]